MNRHDDRGSKDDLDIGTAEALLSRGQVEEKLQSWFPELDAKAVSRLGAYYIELIRYNKLVNLVPASSLKNAASLHFADSLYAGRAVLQSLSADPLYDIGSGNGFPGIVLAVAKPSQKVILVEKDARKADVLKDIIKILGLENVSVNISDVEALPPGSIKNAITRGFLPFPKALMTLRKVVAKDGRFFHMKSDSWANEMSKVPSQLFSYWTPSLIAEYRLPETSLNLAVVVTDKNVD